MADPEPSTKTCRVLTALVVAASLTSILLAVALTRTEWLRDHAGWHLPAVKAAFVMLPVAVLLFAFGVQWIVRRRPVLAVTALPALPVWIATLRAIGPEMPPGATEAVVNNANVLVKDVWIALIFLQMQGVQPFGGA